MHVTLKFLASYKEHVLFIIIYFFGIKILNFYFISNYAKKNITYLALTFFLKSQDENWLQAYFFFLYLTFRCYLVNLSKFYILQIGNSLLEKKSKRNLLSWCIFVFGECFPIIVFVSWFTPYTTLNLIHEVKKIIKSCIKYLVAGF